MFIIRNWIQRHQNRTNFWLHMVGIPMTVVGLVLLFFLPWYWFAGLFIGGYALQAIGHKIEGNTVGEFDSYLQIAWLAVHCDRSA